MHDILFDIENWIAQGETIALATVTETWGSAPRRVGARMAITSRGRIAGSVSGGCVEGSVVEEALSTLTSGLPRLLHFGVADETAWEVGLACGGSIDIFVQALDTNFFHALNSCLENETPVVHAIVIRGADDMLGRQMLIAENGLVAGTFGNEWRDAVLQIGKDVLYQGDSRRVMLDDSLEIFFSAILPSPTLVVVGGVHIAIALVSLAKTLGYRTILVDPRKAWGNDARFPHVDSLLQAWPEDAFRQIIVTRSTAIAMLTHDPKLDDPALKIALASPAFYVGALGSKTTNEKRRKRLLEDGTSESQLARLHAPIGLDIGAQNPEEIALAIMSEIVSVERKQN